jgi:FAD/FMN-containing dehydrogenase
VSTIFLSSLETLGLILVIGSVAVAGGFGQTAGHGPITPLYGLAADQFLEFKVVTADGALQVANKVVNPDLFWALRGGGGSTFGVVVEATVKAHPDVVIDETNWWFNSTGMDKPNRDREE